MKKHYLMISCLFLFAFASNALLAQTNHTVTMVDSQFQPANLTIDQGDMVTWVNQGSMDHTATSGSNCNPDGNWNSGNLASGQSFTHTFSNSGSFPYYCIPHCGINMEGNISVTPGTQVDEINSSDPFELLFTGPNPFKDQTAFIVNLNNNAEVHISLYDMLGNKMYVLHSGKLQMGENHIELDGAVLRSGIYFLRFTSESYFTIHKIVKM